MKLTEYIDKYYGGNKSEFARENGVMPQQVNNWVNGDYIVIAGVLYSPRRELKAKEIKK
ncbi:helix-turn-helix domain-containing protein [Klebsiella aerogenes]|uniref:helix-turn-helix domain-containing protein n=1 Tax=Klebsiella aerogenes TaxID=548 RepID=UPI001CC5AF3A|nr:helix-turn-helix domain-containing protein [Klebsiella aerogenes]UNX66893.1 helix-turn-helix domain-containing protein [Klebsiella aerogenes]